ncbi:MAG TPA: YihY family inner membrane protein [Accumulibacter sp.]|nr:YihY family inner membrane protein [Accumulibacter sp.]HMX21508.1 YihY family inner membrane protein [Accumulibacter sp.]HMY05673.1 YihY family inner membrane protein [Accumulibacter sp.]HNC18116.1 YihY family inner membrane protein [Accumulibacter sp.]HND79429.1 YihY family inner membrane protein [Accumulibacter sp.]
MPAPCFPWRRFAVRVARRFVEEKFDQISASLAFTTLLSLVPLVAIVLSIVALVPFFPSMVQDLEQFLARNLLPERSAEMIIKQVLEFSHKAREVTAIGSLTLAVTVILLLLTIERAFNHVWMVARPRSWWRRLPLFTSLIALWPLVMAGIVLAISYAVTTSLGLIDEPPWLRHILFKALGFLVAALFLGGLYFALPNTRVAVRDAVSAGLFAAIGFIILQKGFAIYLAGFSSYAAVYGAFATVPVFLLWLYASWAVVLLGALVAATLPEFRRERVTSGRSDEVSAKDGESAAGKAGEQ